ncbi:MAG: hypothetical protein MJY86_00090 [Bacteroidales bacterium]|nr:hypothetical protein [Candidatus Cryptobacteroides faecihippi]MCQ2161655.1 hypothetical protein [Bacteroidales bacterium]
MKTNHYVSPEVDMISSETMTFICTSGEDNWLPGFTDGTGDGQGWGTDPLD